MIAYECKCGSRFVVVDNSEFTRKRKREWKTKHRKDKRNPGHGYARKTLKGKLQ